MSQCYEKNIKTGKFVLMIQVCIQLCNNFSNIMDIARLETQIYKINIKKSTKSIFHNKSNFKIGNSRRWYFGTDGCIQPL